MEREMELLGRGFLMIEESHGKSTLNLVLAAAWSTLNARTMVSGLTP